MTDSFSLHPVEKNSGLCFIPPLPESFIPRPVPFNQLKALLTDPAGERTIVLSSREGVGGMGKTCLALALMADDTIQSAFPDGILWANLGQNPDLLSPLAQWLRQLGEPGLSAPTMASEQLRHLIKRRRLLLIVDEVYELSDLEPFQVVADTACRLLVTSRDVEVPQAQSYELGEMTATQAQQFFETQLKKSLEQKNKKDALQFAKSVGYLPLSLNIGVLQVKTGINWSDLLQSMTLSQTTAKPVRESDEDAPRSKRRGFSLGNFQTFWNLDKAREIQHQARQQCLKVCLERLPMELRLRFASLGLFPRNVAITPKMAGVIWGLPIPESRQRLLTLKQQGFLGSGDVDAAQGPLYYLHPVMRDMARWLVSLSPNAPIPGLGLTWPAAHQQFLERYRSLLQDGQWHTIPEDGYIHAHLLWHLEQAGWQGEIHQLLQAFNSEGRNAWYDVCDRLGLRFNYTIDLARAWQLAKQVYEEAPEHSTGLQVRYGLTASFVRQVLIADEDSLSNSPCDESEKRAPLSERLLEDWAFTKVLLKAARYLPDLATKVIQSTFYPSTLTPAFKVQTIVELLQTVHQESPDMALELTEHLLAKTPAFEALICLAPDRPIFCLPLLRLLQQADNAHLAAGLSCLAKIGEHKLQPEIYALLPQLSHPLDRLLILDRLQGRLPERLQTKAIAFRKDCLKELAKRQQGLGELPLEDALGWSPQDIGTAEFLELHDYHGNAIALCFEAHPSAALDQAYRQAMQSRSEEKQSKTLGFLLPKLSDHQRQAVWNLCQHLSDPDCKARLLSRLLRFLPKALEPLLTILKLFENQAKLDKLVHCLPAPNKLMEEIYTTIAALSHAEDRWPYFVRILPHVTPELSQGLIAVIQETPFQTSGICHILKHLTPEQSDIATGILERVEAIPPVYERAAALCQIVPFLPQASQAQALQIAQNIQFPYARVIALQSFIPQFPEIAQDAMAALRNCHEDCPDDLYESLIPLLLDQDRQEAIALIATMPDDVSKLTHLIRTLPYQADLINDIKALVQATPDLRQHCALDQALGELHRICEADLSETNPNPPRTVTLILSMLPLLEWVYHPQRPPQAAPPDNRFCKIIQRYLKFAPQHPPISHSPDTISQLLDFFFFIPYEDGRAEILDTLIQSTVAIESVSPEDWMRWLEKLSRYRPHEFHRVLSSMLPILMSFSNANTLNQTLQAIRTVRDQWNGA